MGGAACNSGWWLLVAMGRAVPIGVGGAVSGRGWNDLQ